MLSFIPTITIGIPAHNEERNLPYMLRSVMRQSQKGFCIEKVFVVCDGCTDHTATVARNLVISFPQLEVIDDGRRLGKVARTNEMYARCQSDYYVSIDADLVLTTNDALDSIISEFDKKQDIQLVAGHLEVTKPSSLIEWISVAGHRLWDETRLSVNGGNHPHNLMGGFYAVRRSFFEHFRFPEGLSSDSGYLYFSVTKNNPDSFQLCTGAKVYFHYPDNLFECRLLATRAIHTKRHALYKYFGRAFVENAYHIPFINKFYAILKLTIKNPVGTIASILLNLYVRAFPIQDPLTKNGMWQTTSSAKKAITK